MKRLIVLFLLIVLLFGCSQTQGETGTKTTANDSKKLLPLYRLKI